MTEPQIMTDAALVTLFGISLCTDLRSGKIPNLVTLPAILIGLTLNLVSGGLMGLAQSVGAIILVLALFLLFAPRVGFGGGDTKLMMAAGALIGVKLTFWAILYAGVAGGIQAIIVLLRNRSRIAEMQQMLMGMAIGTVAKASSPQGIGRIKFPYSPAIAAGVIISLLLQRG